VTQKCLPEALVVTMRCDRKNCPNVENPTAVRCPSSAREVDSIPCLFDSEVVVIACD
jgi:hypothetical protein